MSDFTPRLTDAGMLNSKYWYSSLNPFYTAGFGLANCTAFCFGRTMEILEEVGYAGWDTETYSHLCPHFQNAWTWATDTLWTTGSEPALGAIAVYDTIDSGGNIIGNPGHVAQVEEMPDADTIVISESHYQQTYFDTRTVTRANGWYTPGWLIRFKTFIYLPISVTPGTSDLLTVLLMAIIKKRKKKGGFI